MSALTVGERADFDNALFNPVGYVYISQPEMVYEAPLSSVTTNNGAIIALVPGTPTTGSDSDIDYEMTVELVDNNGLFMGRQRVRSTGTISSSSIPVGRCSKGRRDGELDTDNATTIRVYNERRVWSKVPYIDTVSTGTQYKDQLAYVSDNAAQSPVANAGPDRLAITTDATWSFDFDALGDISSFAVRNGATLSSYLWDVDDGTITTGTASSSAITASFPRGERYVKLTVTDSNSISHTCYVFVVVAHPDDCAIVRFAGELIRRDGVQWEFEGDFDDLSGYRIGTKVLYASHEDYALGDQSIRFSGWLGEERYQFSARSGRKTVVIPCYDVATRLRQLHGFSQSVENNSSSTGWYRMPDANIDRLIHYFWQWHSNVLDLCDFAWSGVGSTYPLPRFDTRGLSLWEQGERQANAIGHLLTFNTLGQLRIQKDNAILPTASQASTYSLSVARDTTVVTTLTTSDYGDFRFEYRRSSHHWLWSKGIVAGTDPDAITDVTSVAPGLAPGQGGGSASQNELLVTSQSELDVITGNRYNARVNPQRDNLRLKMVKTKHYFEPSDMEIITVVLPTAIQSRYGLSSSGDNYYLVEIRNTYTPNQKMTDWVLEPEFIGIVADDVPEPVAC